MKSDDRNKIIMVGLLLTFILEFGQATKVAWPLVAETEHEIHVVGEYPRVGKVFEVVYRVRLKPEIQPEFGKRKFYVKFGSGPSESAEVVGIDEKCIASLIPGEWREVRGKYRIPKPYRMVYINAWLGTAKGHKYRMAGGSLRLYLLDSLTGQYGTGEEYEKGLPVEYRYDFIDGSFVDRYDQMRVSVEENRRIIRVIKEIEPSFSDSLALLLHAEQYQVGVPKGAVRWDSVVQHWIDEGIYEYYLRDGWLQALQEGNIEQWRAHEKEKIKSSWKEGSYNFFRPDSSGCSGSYTVERDTFYKTCDGVWKFKDHQYNIDHGLLAQATKKGVKQGRARVLTTYVKNSNTYRILSHQCVTNDTGYFSVTIKLPSGALNAKAFAIIYPCGGSSDTTSPLISVSDPTPNPPSYNHDPLDNTLYVIKNLYYKDIYANTLPVHFDSVYADTYPEVTQPQSGCINIYETYLHAQIFMNPPPSWSLRVMWEPGYDSTTLYKSTDTIEVYGDTVGNNDEWDDDILLHEYGHYLMRHYATFNQTTTSPHVWYKSYSYDTCLAYQEGWADFFSGRARTGSEYDSLLVDNAHGINSGYVGYLNFEDPWDYSTAGWNPVDSFEGGPWCQGAVCGVLWDIYDSYGEVPYPSYPDSLDGVWFPDTALADSLSMGFDEIRNIFDHYDPPGTPTNCWTVFHFRSGWNYYNYDHDVALDQMLVHHRIRDSIPAPPESLKCVREGDSVKLWWRKNGESDLKGYRIYQKYAPIGPGWWTNWFFLVDKPAPNDTVHYDNTVQLGYQYRYRVTAYDSTGNESDPSDSVYIKLEKQIEPPDRGISLSLPSIMSGTQELKIQSSGNMAIHLNIYDCLGRLIEKRHIKLKANNICAVDISKDTQKNRLANGVYFLYYKTDVGEEGIRKFIVIK